MTDENQELSAEELIAKGQAAAQETANLELDVKAIKDKLRENGKLLGVSFGPNESIPSMHAKLSEARALYEAPPEPVAGLASLTETEADQRQRLYDENMKLVRIRIACLNPNKAGLPGEILTIHSDMVGTVKKYIPYNEAGEAYHVPYILLKLMKRKKFLQIKQPPKGSRAAPTTKLVPEYGIEILEPLTARELEDLKRAQGAAASADDE